MPRVDEYPTGDIDPDDTFLAVIDGALKNVPSPSLRTFAAPAGLVDASNYTATTALVLNNADATTGWTATQTHSGGLTLDTVNFSTGTGSMRALLDMNEGQNGKLYYTFSPVQAISGHTVIAFDLLIVLDGADTDPQVDVVAKVADGAALAGNVNEVSLLGVPLSTWTTIYLPLDGLTEIESIGIHRTATVGLTSPSTLRCYFNIDNLRFIDETKVDVALGATTNTTVWVPPTYTPDADQVPLFLPAGKGLVDPALGVYSKANNVVYLHDFLAYVVGAETGLADVSYAVARIINSAASGQTVMATPGAIYRFDHDVVAVNSGVTIDFTGATCFLTYKTNTPFFTITRSTDLAVKGGTWFGYYPLTANGSTLTTAAGTPTTNGTGKELNALNEEVFLPNHTNWLVASHYARHLPQQVGDADDGLGPRCYFEFVLSDTAQVASDCVISIYDDYWNSMGTSTLLDSTTLTLTATPTTYRVSYFPDSFRQRLKVFVKKATATANTITIASATPYGENEYSAAQDAAACFLIANSSHITIRDAWVEGFGGDAIQISNLNVSDVLVENVSSIKCRRQGMSFNQGTDIRVQNCVIGQSGRSAIDFEPFINTWYTKRVTVKNIKMYDIVNYGLAMGNWARNIYFTVDGIDLYDARIGMIFGGAQRGVFRNLNNYTLSNGLANDFEIAGIGCLFENLRSIQRVDFMTSTNDADIAEGAGVLTYTPANNVVRGIFMPNGWAVDVNVAGYSLQTDTFFASAAPTTGAHLVGERVWNAAPTVGGNIGWVCTVAGTPGTWATFGTVAPAATAMSFNTQTGNYTLVLADANDNVIVSMNLAGANTCTVPPNSSVAFPVGSQIEILQIGAGQTTIVEGAAVTVNKTSTLKLSEQYARAILLKTATNTWVVSGEMALT